MKTTLLLTTLLLSFTVNAAEDCIGAAKAGYHSGMQKLINGETLDDRIQTINKLTWVEPEMRKAYELIAIGAHEEVYDKSSARQYASSIFAECVRNQYIIEMTPYLENYERFFEETAKAD